MPSDPTGRVVRNLIRLQRLGNGLDRETKAILQRIFDNVVGTLAKRNPTGAVRAATQTRRLNALLKELRIQVGDEWPEYHRAMRQGLADIGVDQSIWAAESLQDTVGVAASINRTTAAGNKLKAILDTRAFEGKILSEATRGLRDSTMRNISTQLRLGLANNETLDDLMRRVRGRSNGRGGFVGGVRGVTAGNSLRAIIRTFVTGVAAEGHMLTYEANADVVKGVEFTATLDSRTTEICARWDGTEWPLGSPEIQTPPLHVGCRSVLAPVVDWEGLGVDPPAEGTRASATGQVPASQTYVEWFRKQTPSVQNGIVGPGKADLFRKDKLTFKQMVTGDNQVVPLKDLRT